MLNIDVKVGYSDISGLPELLRKTLLSSLKKAMQVPKQTSKRDYFDAQDWDVAPNPPPGPLVARTTDLRENVSCGAEAKAGDIFTGWLESSLFYGVEHEIGIDLPARPFLRPAVEDELSSIMDIVENSLEKALRG